MLMWIRQLKILYNVLDKSIESEYKFFILIGKTIC